MPDAGRFSKRYFSEHFGKGYKPGPFLPGYANGYGGTARGMKHNLHNHPIHLEWLEGARRELDDELTSVKEGQVVKKAIEKRIGHEDDTVCAICLDDLGSDRYERLKTSCGHFFHRECLRKYMQGKTAEGVNPTCPMCRQNFTTTLYQKRRRRSKTRRSNRSKRRSKKRRYRNSDS
tara:strand:- start:1350 stop:1877 length:528 start_codon:yes stop_codon:yes gene_type:complete